MIAFLPILLFGFTRLDDGSVVDLLFKQLLQCIVKIILDAKSKPRFCRFSTLTTFCRNRTGTKWRHHFVVAKKSDERCVLSSSPNDNCNGPIWLDEDAQHSACATSPRHERYCSCLVIFPLSLFSQHSTWEKVSRY